MIAQHFTLLEKMRDTVSFLVFNSLERKDDPCKSDGRTFYPYGQMRDTLPFVLFNSLDRKDDPCKSDSQTFDPF